MRTVEQIKAEINRLIKNPTEEEEYYGGTDYLEHLESFINSGSVNEKYTCETCPGHTYIVPETSGFTLETFAVAKCIYCEEPGKSTIYEEKGKTFINACFVSEEFISSGDSNENS
jgi:hypothetical protein